MTQEDAPLSPADRRRELQRDLATIEGEERRLKSRLQALQMELDTERAAYSREIGGTEERRRRADERRDTVEEDHLAADLRRLRGELAERERELVSAMGRIGDDLAAISTRASPLRADLDDLNREVDRDTQRDRESELAAYEERSRDLEDQLKRMDAERSSLRAELDSLAQVVEAQREATSASGTRELSEAYMQQAIEHENSWRTWLKWLAVTMTASGIAGGLMIAVLQPEANASTAEIVSSLGVQLLVIGLLLYLVRLISLQFRVHRHLAAVARNKAAALETFNRIVAGPAEAEVRTAVAVALAQAVFTSEDTGFVDATGDHITIVERILGPAAQRLSGP